MITSVLNSILNKSNLAEKFQNNNNSNYANNNYNSNNNELNNFGQIMVLLVILVLWITLVLLVGKYLWNECLCKVLTICKPMDNVFLLLGVIILADIIHPNIN